MVTLALWALPTLAVSLAAQEEAEAETPTAASELETYIAATKAEIAELEARAKAWEAEDELRDERLKKTLDSVVLLESRLADAKDGSEEVEQIFERTKPLVRGALDVMWTVLRRAQEPLEFEGRRRASSGVAARLGGSPISNRGSSLAGELADLEAEERRLEGELARQEVERRVESVEQSLDLAGRLWEIRLTAIHALPLGRKTELRSLEGEGREELLVELEALRVVGGVQLLRLESVVLAAREGLFGLFSALRVGTLAVKLLIVFLLWRWAQSNRERYIRRARERVARLEDPHQRERAQRGVDFLSALAPWGIFLATLLGIRWVMGEQVAGLPFVEPILLLLFVYGIYRLISDVAVGLLANAMNRSGVELSESFEKKLTGRVRWVIRIAMVGLVGAWLIDLRIGEGLIYFHIRNATLIAALATLFLAIGGLRDQIADLFLATRARGPMANLVRRTRGRLSGRLVAPVAFIWLVVISIFGLLRGAFSSLESTRVATAYMARRQLHRSAESGGYASGVLEDLPEPVVEALSSTITVADLEVLDRFDGLDVCRRALSQWRDGEGGGSFLLAGDEGVGKRAWITRLAELEPVDLRIEPKRRILNGKALLRWLTTELFEEDEALTRGKLVSRLEEGPQRIVVIERAERLFLTTVNGYHALAELGPVVDATRHKIFWVVSMGGLAYRHLAAARKDLAFLRRQQWMDVWDEQGLRDLIDHRLSQTGAEVDYSTLVSRSARREDLEHRNRQGRQAYSSLLADFSAGNPKVALFYFARSLEPGPKDTLRVRPFRQPPEEELEAIDESALFILAAVARHSSLTPREAARATDYAVGRVHGRLVRLQDLDVVRVSGGSYRVTTEWRGTVLRVLRRHNILTG